MHLKQHAQLLMGIGLLLSTGCASIMSGQNATVKIDSYPSNAQVVIHNKAGEEVATAMTPAVISLKRRDHVFMPAKYTATVTAPGYESAQIPIRSTLNPWFYGNIVLGGIPGILVDGATGAIWKPAEDTYAQHLKPLPVIEQQVPYSIGQAPVARPQWPAPAPQGPAYAAVPTAYQPAVQQPAGGNQAAPVDYTTLPPAVETTPWPLAQSTPPAAH